MFLSERVRFYVWLQGRKSQKSFLCILAHLDLFTVYNLLTTPSNASRRKVWLLYKAARAFLQNSSDDVDLRDNYCTMVEAVSKQLEGGTRTVALVGRLDDPQLRSSVRLFEKVSKGGWDIKVHDVCTRTLAALEEDPDEGDV